MNTGTSKKGFTLIELLVVIAIIAILAAILMPVFQQAKKRGQQANCASNLKQLAIASSTWAADHDGDLDCSGGSIDGNWPFVERKLGAKPGEPGYVAGDSRRLGITKYCKGSGVMLCPAERGKVLIDGRIGTDVVIDAARQGRLTYAWNYTFNAGAGGKIDTVKYPSKLPVWVEENTDNSVGNTDGNPHVINDGAFMGTDMTSYRHNGFCNVSFVDGHVGQLRGGLIADKDMWPGTNMHIFDQDGL